MEERTDRQMRMAESGKPETAEEGAGTKKHKDRGGA